MSIEQPTLHQLPDDVLLLVMKHLAVDDLFACRLVCERLRGLALHPEVWSHRRLGGADKPCVCAVLGMAPCLDKVLFSKKLHTRAFVMTRCAVRHLTLRLRQGSTDCARACLAVRNQEALGRLRSVQLQAWCASDTPLEDADALLGTLMVCSSSLESLHVVRGLPSAFVMRPVLHGPSRSSLKYFRCELREETETFVNTVLAGHATTLQEVHLGFEYCGKRTFELFVGMPELRGLTCRLFPGMQVLGSCKRLRDVSLSLFDDGTPAIVVLGAVEFFRLLAGQLRTVALEFHNNDGEDKYFADLMAALASSGKSLVHKLSIIWLQAVPPLLRALPRLPALRVLGVLSSPLIDPHFDNRVDELLEGITPATAPNLRRLELSTPDWEGCLHEWLHRDAVARLLTANPSLHVHVWGTNGCHIRGVDCEACSLGCHREATASYDGDVRRIGFFSHGPGKCTHPEDHVTGDKWTWIHIHCNSE